ncbi:MAG: DUF5053 domain-containing protein [Tannerellaceae bacterium]|jgi:hypothetical protein|nr:DUF5053 domain-containing protein [Tannerellaceae bacterium]
MELKSELEKLKAYYNDSSKTEDFKTQLLYLRKKFTSKDELAEIDSYVKDLANESINRTDEFIKDIEVRVQLMEVTEVVSLSYIAKNYFNKTRQWLYQKINGNVVNGKPAKFTPEEINTLNFAIHDISKKLGSITIS